MIKTMLLPLEFKLSEAVNGRDAPTKAAEFHPDLILMDLVMPEMDGFEATKRIRQMPVLKDVAAIIILCK